jgi:hypothetical protein
MGRGFTPTRDERSRGDGAIARSGRVGSLLDQRALPPAIASRSLMVAAKLDGRARKSVCFLALWPAEPPARCLCTFFFSRL